MSLLIGKSTFKSMLIVETLAYCLLTKPPKIKCYKKIIQNQTERQKIDFSGTMIWIFMKELQYSKQAYMAYLIVYYIAYILKPIL